MHRVFSGFYPTVKNSYVVSTEPEMKDRDGGHTLYPPLLWKTLVKAVAAPFFLFSLSVGVKFCSPLHTGYSLLIALLYTCGLSSQLTFQKAVNNTSWGNVERESLFS